MKILRLKHFMKITWLMSVFYTTYGKKTGSGRYDTRILEVDEKTQNTVACEGEKIKLKCSRTSTVLLFYSAYYGRAQKGRVVCRSNDGLGQRDDIICGQIDVTMKLRSICSRRTRCKFKVGDVLFGEICPRVYKYLNVIYACVPRLRKRKHKTEPSSSRSTATPTGAAYTPPSNTTTNVTSALFTNVTVTQSISNNTTGITLDNVTSLEINVTRTVTQQRNTSSSVLVRHHAAVIEKTTAWSTAGSSTPTMQVPLVQMERSRNAKTGFFGSLVVLVMHIRGNVKDYLPVLLSSVGATLGLSIVFALGCLCARKIRRKEHPVAQEVEKQRVNGYRYKTSSSPITNGSLGHDSLARSTKGSLCGSTSSLDKKLPPPPPEMCSFDFEDYEPSRVGPPKFRDGLAALPKTNNTMPNNRNVDSYKPLPGSDVEYVIVQKRNGSKLYLNPMSSFEAGTLARNDNKPRVVHPDPIATELKSLWNGGSGWPVNDGPRAENK